MIRAQLIELTPDSCTLVAEFVIVEQGFDKGLAIVKIALDGERVDIALVADRRHLPALHVRYPPVGKQDEHLHVLSAPKRLDGRAACVA